MFGSRQRMTEAAMFTIGYGKIWHLAVLLIFVWSCQKSISCFIPSFFSAQDLDERPIVSPKTLAKNFGIGRLYSASVSLVPEFKIYKNKDFELKKF